MEKVTVQVRLLGRFCVHVSERAVHFPTRKAESMFAYLLLSRDKPVFRDRVASMFWPDTPETRARRSLNTTLWRIRKALSGNSLGLDIEANERYLIFHGDHAEVDLFKFRGLLESARKLQGALRIDALKQAEEAYGGGLMEGCSDEWCEEERRCVRGQYVGLLKDLVVALRDARDYKAGADYAERVIAIDPLDEDAHRELILLRYLSGNRAGALRQYELLRKGLREELGVEPTKATTELWEHIRSNVASSSAAGVSLPRPGQEAPEGFVAIPMVGRDAYLKFLLRLLENAAGGMGAAVVLCGEIGVGKTKLVDTLAVEAGLRGFEVLAGKSPDLKDPAPYHPFVQALWPRLGLFEQLGQGSSSPLGNLIHALAPGAIPTKRDQANRIRLLNNAIVTEALLGILVSPSGSRPTLLILENIDRIDRASADLLVTLLGRIANSKTLVIATARVGEGSGADNLLSSLTSEGATSLTLERLEEEDTRKLIHASLRSKNVAPPVFQYLWHQTAGNPFFVLEFVKLLCAEGTLTKDSLGRWSFKEGAAWVKTPKLPLRVQGVVRRRIGMLESSARKILIMAALLGIDVELGLLRQLAELSDDALMQGTESLVRERLIEETPSGFRFSHECIRAVTLALPIMAKKRTLHLRVARLLEKYSPGRTEDLAWHFEEAGDFEKAVAYSEASGDKARLVHANDDAAHWYTHALAILERFGVSDQTERLRCQCTLLAKRQEVLDVLGDRSKQLEDIELICRIGSKLGDCGILARTLSLRATLFVSLNLSEQAIETATRARALFSSLNDADGEARSYLTTGRALVNLRRYDQAFKSFQKALCLFQQAGDLRESANTLVYQGMVLTNRSQYSEALENLSEAEQILQRADDLRAVAYTRMQKALIYRLLGRARKSELLILSSMEVFSFVRDRVGEARALVQLALTQAALGKHREAVHNARKALRVARQTRDVRAQINILNNLGVEVYRRVGDFSRARRCISEAMELISDSSGQENPAMYQDSMAAILLDEGNTQEALEWSNLSLASCTEGEMGLALMAEINFRLGCVHFELGEYAKALDYLGNALVANEGHQEAPLQVRIVCALSRTHLLLNDKRKSLAYSRRALTLLSSVDWVDLLPVAYWTHSQTLRAIGARIEAERFLRRAHAAVTRQATKLKGRMKTRFLTRIRINSEILCERMSDASQVSVSG